ncbi:hypothetical protein AB0I55_28920 [Actinocatenispora sera]|uniref:hypothetical protein n=1 Tax=Actinocatenispora sera TaxID=390989 RepID=UPI0033DB2F4B
MPGPGGFDTGLPQPSGAPYARLPGPGWSPERRILIGDALTAFGGLLVFAFSFAPFVGYSDDSTVRDLARENLPTWFSAWATETFMAPLTWFVVLGGLISISLAAARMAVPREREVAGFRTGHLQIGVSIFVFLVLFGYATSAKSIMFGHDLGVSITSLGSSEGLDMSLGWGGYLMLFGSLVAAVGAVLSHLEIGPTVYPQPPRPAAPVAAGYPQQPGYPPAQQAYPPAGGDQPTAPYPTVPQPGQPAPQPPAAQPAPPAGQPVPPAGQPAPPAGQPLPPGGQPAPPAGQPGQPGPPAGQPGQAGGQVAPQPPTGQTWPPQ